MKNYSFLIVLALGFLIIGSPLSVSAKTASKTKANFFQTTVLSDKSATYSSGTATFGVDTLKGGGEDMMSLVEDLVKDFSYKKGISETEKYEKEITVNLKRVETSKRNITNTEYKGLYANLKEQRTQIQALNKKILDGKAFGFTKKTLKDADNKGTSSNASDRILLLAKADRVTDLATWMQDLVPSLKQRIQDAGLTTSVAAYEEKLASAKTNARTAADSVIALNAKADAAVLATKLVTAKATLAIAVKDLEAARTNLKTILTAVDATKK